MFRLPLTQSADESFSTLLVVLAIAILAPRVTLDEQVVETRRLLLGQNSPDIAAKLLAGLSPKLAGSLVISFQHPFDDSGLLGIDSELLLDR
jgi:hypothetical protein